MNAAELIEKITELCEGKDPAIVNVMIEVYDGECVEYEYEDAVDVAIVTNFDNANTIVIKY